MNTAKILSLFSIMETYKTELDAVRYFEKIRWNNKPVCVKCGSIDKITQQRNQKDYWCKSCRSYFNVFTDTPLHRAKVDIRKWIYTSYLLMTARKGISSLQLSKEIGVKQPTAWYMLHRLRLACSGDDKKLSGIVEIDETYLGGKEKNKHTNKKTKGTQGRSMKTKTAVIGARERNGNVTAMLLNKTDGATMKGFVHDNVAIGSTVYTDDHKGYVGLDGLFYRHQSVNHSAKEYVNGMAHTNGIESVWAVLKRGYHGTFHNISAKHLQRYVDEFTFRLNEGNCRIDTQERLDQLFAAMSGKTITYKALIA